MITSLSFDGVDLSAVFISGIASMIVGFLWYSPALFGKMWVQESGMTPEKLAEAKKKGMSKIYFMTFIAALVTAYALAVFIDNVGVTNTFQVIQISFWLWLGFMATLKFTDKLFQGTSTKLLFLDWGHNLVSMLLMGIIIVSMK